MKALLGAVLAGGLSSRMGSDKATLRPDGGQTMLDRAADALRAVCGDVVIVGGQATTLSACDANPGQARGYVVVADLRPSVGPLGGIEALLASNLAREYLVCPCDVPLITPHVLRLLLTHRDAPATVLRIAGRDNIEPLPARIASNALAVVQQLLNSGERSVWKLMEVLPAAIVDIDAHHAATLRNVNTPEDLRAF